MQTRCMYAVYPNVGHALMRHRGASRQGVSTRTGQDKRCGSGSFRRAAVSNWQGIGHQRQVDCVSNPEALPLRILSHELTCVCVVEVVDEVGEVEEWEFSPQSRDTHAGTWVHGYMGTWAHGYLQAALNHHWADPVLPVHAFPTTATTLGCHAHSGSSSPVRISSSAIHTAAPTSDSDISTAIHHLIVLSTCCPPTANPAQRTCPWHRTLVRGTLQAFLLESGSTTA